MIEYINKTQAIIEMMDNDIDHAQGTDGREVVQILEDIPAADVIPVVHGRWIPHREKSREYIGTVLVHVRYDYWFCDTCGYRVESRLQWAVD